MSNRGETDKQSVSMSNTAKSSVLDDTVTDSFMTNEDESDELFSGNNYTSWHVYAWKQYRFAHT